MISPIEFSPAVPVPVYEGQMHPALYIITPYTMLSPGEQHTRLANLGRRYAEVIMANLFAMEDGHVEVSYGDWTKTETGDQYQAVRLWTPGRFLPAQRAAEIGGVAARTIREMQWAEEQERMITTGAFTFQGRLSIYQEIPADILAKYNDQAPRTIEQ